MIFKNIKTEKLGFFCANFVGNNGKLAFIVSMKKRYRRDA